MKRVIVILSVSFMLAMCGTTNTAKGKSAAVKRKPDIQHRDDFRAAPDAEKQALLKQLNAAGPSYSVLIFTQNFKGEKIIATAGGKTVYNNNVISNLRSGIAEKIRIDNRHNTRVYDNYTKKDIVIEAVEAKKHKFIYLMKNPGSDNAFTITYSNTLRPLE